LFVDVFGEEKGAFFSGTARNMMTQIICMAPFFLIIRQENARFKNLDLLVTKEFGGGGGGFDVHY